MPDQYDALSAQAIAYLRAQVANALGPLHQDALAAILRGAAPPVIAPPPARPPLDDYPVPGDTDDVMIINEPGRDVVIDNIRMRAKRPGQTAIAVHKAASFTLRNFDLSGFRESVVIVPQDGTRVGKLVIDDGIIHGITPVAGKRHQAIYIWGVDFGWLERVVMDGSTARPATEQSHLLYAAGNGNVGIDVMNCWGGWASSHGFMVRCSGSVADSVAIDCPISFSGGGGFDEAVPGGVDFTLRDCVARGGGDIDGAPRGIALWLSNLKIGHVYHNVFCDGKGTGMRPLNIAADEKFTMGVLNTDVYDNVVRNWPGGVQVSDGPMDGTTIEGMEDQKDTITADLSVEAWAGPDWLARLRNRELSAKDYAAWVRQRVGLE